MPCAFCGRWLAGAPPWRRLNGTPRAWQGLGIAYWSTDQAGDAWVTTCDWRYLDYVEQELRRGRTQIEAARWDLDVVAYATTQEPYYNCHGRPGARQGRSRHASYAERAADQRGTRQPERVAWCRGVACRRTR